MRPGLSKRTNNGSRQGRSEARRSTKRNSAAKQHPAKRTTLRQIAAEAGVSTGTVSMVLNRSALVADATREKVQRVIQDLGYIYDRGAAQLRSRRTNIVGLSVCNLANPYFAEVAIGIEKVMGDLGRVLVLGNCEESVPKQTKFLETLREYNMDGLLLMPASDTTKSDVEDMLKWPIPLVMVSRYVNGIATDFVGSDNEGGIKLATKHLIDLGHRRIAYIGSNRRTTTGRERLLGYRRAMRGTGIPLREDLIVECGDSRVEGFNAAKKVLELKDPPTGIVCFNDVLAFGAMLALRDLGLVPGRDCSVVGHDDVMEAELWNPQLTTVTVDVDEMGRQAGRLLRDRIDGLSGPPQRYVLPPRLVVRSTCSPPPAKTPRVRAL
jgi:LacI family transcriptional regulator